MIEAECSYSKDSIFRTRLIEAYSSQTLYDMSHKKGEFKKQYTKLKRLIKISGNSNFTPVIPSNSKLDDLKTIIDLAVICECDSLLLQENEHKESVERRARSRGLAVVWI